MFKVCPHCSSTNYRVLGNTFSCFNCKVVGLKYELESDIPDYLYTVAIVCVLAWFLLFPVPAFIANRTQPKILELPCTIETNEFQRVPASINQNMPCEDVQCLEEVTI